MKIGQRIREVFDQMPKTCNIGWLANQLHCDRRNVYRIFERDNIDIVLLAKISRVLDHDFFKELSDDIFSKSCPNRSRKVTDLDTGEIKN